MYIYTADYICMRMASFFPMILGLFISFFSAVGCYAPSELRLSKLAEKALEHDQR